MKKQYLAITTSTGLNIINSNEILYCLSDGSYTNIYLEGDRKFTVAKNLKEVENNLADPQFFRIHNSHIINLAHTVSYVNNGHNCVRMSDGEELAVARNRKKDFLDLFDRL